MSRHADGKTHLETECLSKVPMSQQQVATVWDVHRHAAKGDSVIVALCLSHERLRAELSGLKAMIASDQQEIASTLKLLRSIGESADLWDCEDAFELCCASLEKLLPKGDSCATT